MAEALPSPEGATASESMADVQEETDSTTAGAPLIEESNDTAETPAAPGPNSIRSRGSKVSNLRAAFEQSGNAPPPAPRSISAASNGRNGNNDAELARLKELLAKEQEAREADKQRMDELHIEIEDLREELRSQREMPDEPMLEQENGHVDAERLAEDLHLARAQAHAYEDELAALRSQLNDMKRSIATNTRIESHEVTDSAFQGEFGTLCYLLQDWIVSSYRKCKVEKSIGEMLEAVEGLPVHQQQILKALFERWEPASKLVILQSAAIVLMLPIFQDTLPFGLPASSSWSRAVREASEELHTVLDSVAYNRWRATTFDVICHTEAISPFVHSAANSITNSVVQLMLQVCGLETSEGQTDALRNVVRRMIALSHSLRVQRASYDVALPSPGLSFDHATMEGVSGDHDDSADHIIECAVFPAVYKSSPSNNRALLFKARVAWKESWD